MVHSPSQGKLSRLIPFRIYKIRLYVWVIRHNKIERVHIKVLEQRYSNNSAVVQGLQTGDRISRIKFNEKDLHQMVTINP